MQTVSWVPIGLGGALRRQRGGDRRTARLSAPTPLSQGLQGQVPEVRLGGWVGVALGNIYGITVCSIDLRCSESSEKKIDLVSQSVVCFAQVLPHGSWANTHLGSWLTITFDHSICLK